MPAPPKNNYNPVGRPKGSPNKKNQEMFTALAARGDKDPLDVLSGFASDTSKPDEFRATCANYIMPYKYAKRAAMAAPRFVDDHIQVPDFQSIEQAQSFLAHLSTRAGAGELELQSALDVSTLVKNWILSKQASIELDLKVANSAANVGDQTIHITGGLPPLPGTNITMPMINGHTIDGQALMPPADQGQGPSPTDDGQGPSPTDEHVKNSFATDTSPGPSDAAPPTTDSASDPNLTYQI